MCELIVCVFIYVVIVAIAYCPKKGVHCVVEQPVDYFPEVEKFDIHQYITELPAPGPEADDYFPEEIGAEVVNAEWYMSMTIRELKAIAKERKVKGYGRMTKSLLAEALVATA